MNAFLAIKEAVERETGLECVFKHPNIEDNQVLVDIREIEQTGIKGKYLVNGEFSIKVGAMHGWTVLTQVLELALTGTRAESSFSENGDGFSVMSVEFSVVVQEEKGRTHLVRGYELEEVLGE